jgi:hypothetical protein
MPDRASRITLDSYIIMLILTYRVQFNPLSSSQHPWVMAFNFAYVIKYPGGIGGDDIMGTKSEYVHDTSDTGNWGNLEPRCSYCTSGHTIAWYVEPPPECPYCNAKLLPGHDACLSFPGLSW